MTIFALDASSKSGSAAIWKDGEILAENFLNIGLTHSETLLPLSDEVFRDVGLSPSDIDYYAVTCGPGSFTGLRIGIGTIKGFAFPNNTPCVAVSTLEALAFCCLFSDAVIVPVIDARRNRVYCAAFLMQFNGKLHRIQDDEILSLPELGEKLKNYRLPVVFVGDAGELCYNEYRKTFAVVPTPHHLSTLRASAVAAAAKEYIDAGKILSSAALSPFYMQESQAERQRKKKENGE